jgi:hypothetical protein
MLEFLPFWICLALTLLGIFFLFVVYPNSQKKHSLKLLNALGADFIFPMGTIKFEYKGRVFFIKRVSAGRRSGAYPVLWTEVESTPKTIVGNIDSKRFYRGFFPENVEIINGNVLLASSDLIFLNSFKNKVSAIKNISSILDKNFSHIAIDHEWHVEGPFGFRKKCILSYICLSEEIYSEPQIIYPQLDIICNLL